MAVSLIASGVVVASRIQPMEGFPVVPAAAAVPDAFRVRGPVPAQRLPGWPPWQRAAITFSIAGQLKPRGAGGGYGPTRAACEVSCVIGGFREKGGTGIRQPPVRPGPGVVVGGIPRQPRRQLPGAPNSCLRGTGPATTGQRPDFEVTNFLPPRPRPDHPCGHRKRTRGPRDLETTPASGSPDLARPAGPGRFLAGTLPSGEARITAASPGRPALRTWKMSGQCRPGGCGGEAELHAGHLFGHLPQAARQVRVVAAVAGPDRGGRAPQPGPWPDVVPAAHVG
jgi:hypothetical protein